MFCPNCGAKRFATDKFCENCGERFVTNEASARTNAGDIKEAEQKKKRNNPDGIADKQEYFEKRASTLAIQRIKTSKKVLIITTIAALLFMIITIAFLSNVQISTNNDPVRRELLGKKSEINIVGNVLVGIAASCVLIAWVFVCCFRACKKLTTEYAVIGLITGSLAAVAVAHLLPEPGFISIFYVYCLSTVYILLSLYRFNAEFHAQAPAMEDTVLMRQRNSMTKVIVFWSIGFVLPLSTAIGSFIADKNKKDIAKELAKDLAKNGTYGNLLALFVFVAMIVIIPTVFVWLAYKITKTLRTGSEEKGVQTLHALSIVIIAATALCQLLSILGFLNILKL